MGFDFELEENQRNWNLFGVQVLPKCVSKTSESATGDAEKLGNLVKAKTHDGEQ